MEPASVMRRRALSYPTIAALFFAVMTALVGLTEYSRIFPQLQQPYAMFKTIYAIAGFLIAFRFYRWGVSDLWATGFFTLGLVYVLTFMWFTPMYETAYLQIALCCSFIRLRRTWLYTFVFFLGLLGILLTYVVQDSLGWKTIAPARADWVWIMVIFFLISALVHKFAVSVDQKERDRMARFGLIGMESSRIIHDLKGLLSSPLMIVELLQSRGKQLQPEVFERQMVLLHTEMEKIREMIKSINRLVVVDDTISPVNILATIEAPMKILDRRLKHVTVQLPDDRLVQGNPERMQSIFFNLFINSIEAFEDAKIALPEIKMSWRGNTLVVTDNGGGLKDHQLPTKSTKAGGSGLGLQLVEADLERMGAKFNISSKNQSTIVEIAFRPA
jgi:signal transduction histidine kinase